MKLIIIIMLVIIVFSKNAFASLKLNEIYPAPPSGEYEWIELYNDENSTVNIQNFYLTDSSGKKISITDETLGPYSFTIASTPSGVLNNSNQTGKNYADIVYLYDTNNQPVDIATYSGTFDSTKTYAKCPNSWFVLNTLTKNSSNEIACQILTPSPSPTLEPTLTLTPTLTIVPTSPTLIQPTPTDSTDLTDIYLSEVMTNPLTGEKEWVEIYNNNDFSVSLNNWYIDDLENTGSSPKIFSLQINAKSYGVFDLNSSIFNNDGDSIRLLDFNKNLKDDFEYGKTEQGKTLGRTSIDSDDFCIQEPSKNSTNNSCINPTPTVITPTPTEKIILSSTTKNIPSIKLITEDSNFDVSIHRSINYPTGIVQNNNGNGNVLGIKDELVINSPNIKSLINLLTILSISYSLLTICSILFRMKLSYGKNKNFYSSPLRSS